jgi:hypothetical protein
MTKILSSLLVAAALVVAPALAHAESTGKKSGKAKFDPSTAVTVNGTVLGEQRVDNGKGAKAVRLVLKVADDQVSVHLGPESWVDKQPVKLAAGDEVTVRGSKFTYSGKYGIVAQWVKKGGETLTLRDANGKAAWPAPKGTASAAVSN